MTDAQRIVDALKTLKEASDNDPSSEDWDTGYDAGIRQALLIAQSIAEGF